MARVAIVTGGSGGIGKALGRALVARGDDVVLAARTRADVERAADELSRQGPGKARAEVLDVCDADAVAEVVNAVHRDNGRLDLMVNNAGIRVGGGLIDEMTPGYWDPCYETNVRGVLNGVYAAYPLMIEQGFGQIANTASIAGLIPTPFEAPYSTSKFAVVGFTLTLRMEAARQGVRVNLICPGPVDTSFWDKPNPAGLRPVQHPLKDVRTMLRHGMRARLGNPEDIAADVLRDLDRNKAIIVRPATSRWICLAYRLSPNLTMAYGRMYVAWGSKRLGRG